VALLQLVDRAATPAHRPARLHALRSVTALTVPAELRRAVGPHRPRAITPNIAVVLRGERAADAALAGELAAMGLV